MTAPHSAPEAPERVLPTLNSDGTRRWLRPRVSPGRFRRARGILAYILIAVFTLTPHVQIGGKPAILLDIMHRKFTILGKTFLPTDTALLALLAIGVIVTVFLVTAVLGRAWCGYACPQTVYLEFVYRPIERLFDGPPGRGGSRGKKATPARTLARYGVYLVISAFLAHTFLSYFVGVDALRHWVLRSPFEHPTSFLVMAATTAVMMFDFSYFREQTCIVACPYGRFQSVLLDRDSLIVSYDPKRDDCVDCGLCVETCPTGIDIREGLKMECIGCAQCIDACDSVMDKVKRPRGLVRYSSQAKIAGESGRFLRPRLFVYPAILLVVATLFFVVLAGKKDTDVTLLRGFGAPFVRLEGGEISNAARLKITNRGEHEAAYRLEIAGAAAGRLVLDEDPVKVPAGNSRTAGVLIVVPSSVFVRGRHDMKLRISDGKGFQQELKYRLVGPAGKERTHGAR